MRSVALYLLISQSSECCTEKMCATEQRKLRNFSLSSLLFPPNSTKMIASSPKTVALKESTNQYAALRSSVRNEEIDSINKQNAIDLPSAPIQAHRAGIDHPDA